MSNKFDKLFNLQHKALDTLNDIKEQLQELNGLMSTQLLLQELVSTEGEERTPDQAKEIICAAFNAAISMNLEIKQTVKSFNYSLDEFYVDEELDEDESCVNEGLNDEEDGFSKTF
jgi:hypothetical protein